MPTTTSLASEPMPAADATRCRVAVVADDLSGAADAAAPFAHRGLDVSVALDGPPRPGAQVVGLVTDNRWRTPEAARQRMLDAVALARAWGPDLLFVKIDSTLRGRVRDDVATALAAWSPDAPAVATPAFPDQGRTVADGRLAVHGTPHPGRVADRFPDGVEVLDAVSHADLLAAARAVVDEGRVAVGSGGLARALAEVLVPEPPERPDRRASGNGVLVVAGSPHPATVEQVDRLAEAGALVLGATVDGDADVAAAAAALDHGRRVVLAPEPGGVPAADSPEAVLAAGALATAAVAALDATTRPTGLVLTGGATALAVARALGAHELRLLGEVAVGLPLGELVTADRRIPVVTKSGGFGVPECLLDAAAVLEEHT